MTTRFNKVALACLIWGFAGAAAWAQIPDGPGKDVTVQLCGNCHEVDVVKQYHQEKSAWADTISQMVEKGLVATDDQLNTILEYLVKNFGPPINVNKATASDLERQLEITAKEAAAIVQYRGEKGSFKEIDDLKKVPDLDFKKIEAKKDRLVF
jgi:competence protein ComEA